MLEKLLNFSYEMNPSWKYNLRSERERKAGDLILKLKKINENKNKYSLYIWFCASLSLYN